MEGESDMSQDENLGEASESSQVQLIRSNKNRQPPTRYYSNKYETSTNEGELECYHEAVEVMKIKNGRMQCEAS